MRNHFSRRGNQRNTAVSELLTYFICEFKYVFCYYQVDL